MKKSIVLGVDSSTSATKVIAFDTMGKTLAEGTAQYPLYMEKPGWIEQDSQDWWKAFRDGCQKILSQSNINVKDIIGLGITHQRFTFVPVDRNIQPLRRAILWNDTRCYRESAYAEKEVGKQKIFERTGYPPGVWTLYKVLWLKNNESDIYEKMYKVVLVQDYLIYKLTGKLVTLQGSCTMTGALDIEARERWAKDVIRDLGVREDVWIQTIHPGGSIAGTVTKQASQETGLPEGLPVVTGAGDQPCGILGAGVINPGEMGINGGTSCTNELIAKGVPERKVINYFIELSPSGEYIVENYIPSGGSALMNWYKDHLGYCEMEQADKEKRNVWEIIYGLAGETPVGNRGMMVVPYFQGANGPYWDMTAKGIIVGLRQEYGRPYFIRGFIEGLAYESRRQMELMEEGTSTKVQEIRMYGGSARSDYWNQVFTDALNRPLYVPENTETTALGAAISATVGCGIYDSFTKAASMMVRIKESYNPIPRNVERYNKLYTRVYSKLYDQLNELMKTSSEIITECEKQ